MSVHLIALFLLFNFPATINGWEVWCGCGCTPLPWAYAPPARPLPPPPSRALSPSPPLCLLLPPPPRLLCSPLATPPTSRAFPTSVRQCRTTRYAHARAKRSVRTLPSGVTHLLLRELPDYMVACQGTCIDRRDVNSFTSDMLVLAWWAANHSKFPTWQREKVGMRTHGVSAGGPMHIAPCPCTACTM